MSTVENDAAPAKVLGKRVKSKFSGNDIGSRVSREIGNDCFFHEKVKTSLNELINL